MSKKGGYVIVDLKGQTITAGTPFTLDGVTARLDRAKNKACLLSGFAIGDEEKRDVFVDLQKTEDGYVAFFGQYTITIEDDEVTITNGGVLLDDIVDLQGHKRFIEGELILGKEGLTSEYSKWSLSGSHLIIVGYIKIPAGTAIAATDVYYNVELPTWVLNKVKTIASTLVNPSMNFTPVLSNGVSTTPAITAYLLKQNDKLVVRAGGATAREEDIYVRIQFDILIDADDAE